MNKDRVEGKVKDIAGPVERQAGEWTGNTKAQVSGAAKQAEGKVQNAWGKAKDAAKDSGMKKDNTEHGHLKVTDLKMVSDSCNR